VLGWLWITDDSHGAPLHPWRLSAVLMRRRVFFCEGQTGKDNWRFRLSGSESTGGEPGT